MTAKVSGVARVELADDLARKYQEGASIRDLSRETGMSYGFVHGLLLERGVTLRTRGGPRQRRTS